jgi:Protein of unknown function (DUF1631)
MATNFNPLNAENLVATVNVFPFPGANAQHARRQNVKPESVRVINDCRDIALKRITDVLSKTFDTIEDELFEMAEKSIDRAAQNLYLDARAQAREKRGAIAIAFKKQFLSFFEQKMSGEGDAKKSMASSFNALELSLVADDDLEEKLAVEAISKRLTNNCDEELRAVSQRLGFLMSEPELNDEANPISPDTIVKALQIACEQMTAGYQSKLTVMRLVEAGMAKEMMGVYRDINAHLVSRHVLPQIRPTYHRPQASGSRATPSAGAAAATTTSHSAAAGAATAAAPAQSAQDLFATLQQLIASGNSGNTGANTANVGMGLFGNGSAPNGGGMQDTDSITSTGLISALTDIQHQLMAGRAETAQFAAMLNLQNFVPGETPNASLNFLREIKQQAVATGSNQVDAMTIDIIAMLFDYVFEDKAIPDSVKALLAKLQIPVLKVAIMDKSFFSLKTHPARRLLDVLAEASVCFAGQASKEDPLYQQIEAVVNRIHDEFATDVALFSTMLAEFEAFLFTRESASADRAEQSARAVHESEKREMARMIAIDETDRRANESQLPIAVSAMLRGPWARVLERVYIRDGGRTENFAEFLEAADDLIWSVTPKLDQEQRQRLVRMLPALLKRLQDGMEIAAVEQQDRERFFGALVDCHAAAVKAGLRGESVTPLIRSSVSTAETAPLFEKLINEEKARETELKNSNRSGIARIQFTDTGVEIEEIVAASINASSKADNAENGLDDAITSEENSFDLDQPMPALKRGAWLEFMQAGGSKIRAKLTWVSPLKGVYLFTNPGASEALSITPDVLEAQFKRGQARLIEESSLIDRAVDSLVNSLAGASAAA